MVAAVSSAAGLVMILAPLVTLGLPAAVVPLVARAPENRRGSMARTVVALTVLADDEVTHEGRAPILDAARRHMVSQFGVEDHRLPGDVPAGKPGPYGKIWLLLAPRLHRQSQHVRSSHPRHRPNDIEPAPIRRRRPMHQL